MNRKAIAIALVLMMVATSLVFIPSDDSDAESEVYRGASYYSPDLYWYRSDGISFTYTGEKPPHTFYADLNELDVKDAEFDAYIHGGPEYENSPLIDGHNYTVYWKSMDQSKSADKTFFVKGNCDEIYLNGGSYEIKIMDITYLFGSSGTVAFVRSYGFGGYTNVEYEIKKGETYAFSSNDFNAYWFRTYSTPVLVEYEINAKSVATDLGSTRVSDVSINNIYAWYKTDVSLSGLYSIDPEQIMFEKGSKDEKRFVEEIVSKNLYYSYSEPDPYNSLKDGYYEGTFVIYKLCKSVNLREKDSISIYNDTGRITSFMNIVLERQTEDKVHLFSTAYSQFTIAIGDYDTEKYSMYLVYSASAIPLGPNSVYTIDNRAAKTYTLVVENKNNDTDSLYTTVAISVEGTSEEESNPDLFAGICIGLCILVFGIILISGKKPKWSKKKYDKKLAKKSNAKAKQQGPEQPMQQAPAEEMSQQPPVAPAEDSVPKADAPMNEEAPVQEEEVPKKKGLFRKSKEE